MHVFYDRITDKLREVLSLANNKARVTGSPLVSKMHLLWGLLKAKTNIGCQILENLSINTDALLVEISKEITSQNYSSYASIVPYGEDARQTIVATLEEGIKAKYIGCQHLLLAFLSREDKVHKILNDLGVYKDLVVGEIGEIVVNS